MYNVTARIEITKEVRFLSFIILNFEILILTNSFTIIISMKYYSRSYTVLDHLEESPEHVMKHETTM